jgi:ABC-2 type transport system permease protein
MFTYLFGGAIEGSTGEYLQFLLPGVLVMAVLLTTTYSGIALNADRPNAVVDRFRSLPVWAAAPLVGAVAGDAVRYALAASPAASRDKALTPTMGSRSATRARVHS